MRCLAPECACITSWRLDHPTQMVQLISLSATGHAGRGQQGSYFCSMTPRTRLHKQQAGGLSCRCQRNAHALLGFVSSHEKFAGSGPCTCAASTMQPTIVHVP